MKLRLSLVALFFTTPALAQAVDCSDAFSQMEMNQCAADLWHEADRLLNQRYKEAIALLESWDSERQEAGQGGAATLRQAQRAWIAYRDAACEVDGWPMRGGSAEPLLVLGCRKRLTEQRIADLEALLEYEGL